MAIFMTSGTSSNAVRIYTGVTVNLYYIIFIMKVVHEVQETKQKKEKVQKGAKC